MINNQTYPPLLSTLPPVDFAMADDSYWCICTAVISSIFGGIALVAFFTWLTCYCKRRVATREEQRRQTNTEDPIVVARSHVQVEKTEEPQPVAIQVVKTVKEDDTIVYPVANTS
jgi:hypothetical protein